MDRYKVPFKYSWKSLHILMTKSTSLTWHLKTHSNQFLAHETKPNTNSYIYEASKLESKVENPFIWQVMPFLYIIIALLSS